MTVGRRLVSCAGTVLVISAAAVLGQDAWIAAKARLAEAWIEAAYESYLRDGLEHRPWSWADTVPVARLEVARLDVRRIVLSGASGSSLAFGPGHVDGTALPNEAGTSVLAGHRDGSFAFLAELRPGDAVDLETYGMRRRYRVREIDVRSMWDTDVLEPAAEDRLALITCYPFGGLARSPWRYVVTCEPEPA